VRIVCFDIDGTLINTVGAGRRAIHRAMVDVLGSAGPIDTFRFDGRTDGEIVLRLAEGAGITTDEALVQRALGRYVELLKSELNSAGRHTIVYPGILPLLTALEARTDAVIGLLTGNVAEGARLKLRSAHIDPDRFRIGAFGSDHHVRAELPAVAQRRAAELVGRPVAGGDVVIIGDTPADMTCGRGIGARAIGVGTAAYRPADLAAAGAAATFENLSDTGAVLEAVFG
jgi:phosphoglycolate phosphatase-like HAD superfamily hydrolase